MVEKLIKTIANMSCDQSLHNQMIENGIIQMLKMYVQLFLNQATELEEDIQMEVFPIICLNLVQSLSKTIMNICQNSWVVQKNCV